MFPDTPTTLLHKISKLSLGNDEAEWTAFVELYTPPLRCFIRSINAALSEQDVEDAIQDVFIRLVEVLRRNKIDRTHGKFRAYLAAMTRRILIDRYRANIVRPEPLADGELGDMTDGASLSSADPGVLVDMRWRLAAHEAAVEHVLSRTAISEQSRAVYRALVGLDPRYKACSAHEIAAAFGISYAALKQVKSRMDRAVAAIENQL